MPQTLLKPKPHLSYHELAQRYRSCKNSREKTHWQLIWLMANPEKPLLVKQAAETVGFCQRWARQLVHRYNAAGAKGLIDKRKDNMGGQEPALNQKQKDKLRNALLNEAPADGGLWTSVKVAEWIKQETGKLPVKTTGWHYLKALGFTLQQPRPLHKKAATLEEIKQFKKNFHTQRRR